MLFIEWIDRLQEPRQIRGSDNMMVGFRAEEQRSKHETNQIVNKEIMMLILEEVKEPNVVETMQGLKWSLGSRVYRTARLGSQQIDLTRSSHEPDGFVDKYKARRVVDAVRDKPSTKDLMRVD